VDVAKSWDDLRLGVISQSNLVIAGSLRKILKYRRPGPSFGVGWSLAKVFLGLWRRQRRGGAADTDVSARRCHVKRATAQTAF